MKTPRLLQGWPCPWSPEEQSSARPCSATQAPGPSTPRLRRGPHGSRKHFPRTRSTGVTDGEPGATDSSRAPSVHPSVQRKRLRPFLLSPPIVGRGSPPSSRSPEWRTKGSKSAPCCPLHAQPRQALGTFGTPGHQPASLPSPCMAPGVMLGDQRLLPDGGAASSLLLSPATCALL